VRVIDPKSAQLIGRELQTKIGGEKKGDFRGRENSKGSSLQSPAKWRTDLKREEALNVERTYVFSTGRAGGLEA